MTFVFDAQIDVEGTWPNFMIGRGMRLYNRIVKQAIRNVLEHHHKHRIPQHFDRDKQKQYNYKPRKPKYNAWKGRFMTVNRASKKYGRVANMGAVADLVRSGNTKKLVKNFMQIRMKGTMKKANVEGSLVYHLPFPRRDLPTTRVKFDDIVEEIGRILGHEATEMVNQFGQDFLNLANQSYISKHRYYSGATLLP